MSKTSAKIDINITNFVDVTQSKAFSTATFTLETNPPPPPGIVQNGEAIEISEIVKLVFRFKQPEFKPIDIMFAQIVGASDDDGRSNLVSRIRRRKGGNWVIIVLDTLSDGGPTNPARWKYFIALQRVADGKIGIIDPEISNTDQE
jgi:hypothetical protein